MTKVVTLIKSDGMPREEFREHLRSGLYADLMQLPDATHFLAKVVHNVALQAELRPDNDIAPGGWAGAIEWWFYDRSGAERFLQSPEVAKCIAAHAERLPEIVNLHVQEVDGWDLCTRKPDLKGLSFFIPRDGVSRAEAQLHWNTHHLRETARLGMSQKLVKYVQNHTLPDFLTTNPDYNFAGGPEMWFETPDHAQSIFADIELLTELQKDEVKFANHARSIMFLVEEETVFRAG